MITVNSCHLLQCSIKTKILKKFSKMNFIQWKSGQTGTAQMKIKSILGCNEHLWFWAFFLYCFTSSRKINIHIQIINKFLCTTYHERSLDEFEFVRRGDNYTFMLTKNGCDKVKTTTMINRMMMFKWVRFFQRVFCALCLSSCSLSLLFICAFIRLQCVQLQFEI